MSPGQCGTSACSPKAARTRPAMSGTMLHATIADRRTRLSAVRVATAASGAAKLQRIVMLAQARDPLGDFARERLLAFAGLSLFRDARRECAFGEAESAIDQIAEH